MEKNVRFKQERGYRVARSTKPVERVSRDPAAVEKTLNIIERLLLARRWDDQGGYAGYAGNGKWGFFSCALDNVTPEELNTLFAAVGIKPDEIKSRGPCSKCKFSVDGEERGYAAPCGSCTRPFHSHFQPKKPKEID